MSEVIKIFIVFSFLYFCLKNIKMKKIVVYFEAVLYMIICTIPSVVSLLIFDHEKISNNDIIKSIGMWSWVYICVAYSAVFTLIYKTNIRLIPNQVYVILKQKINYEIETDEKKNEINDWKGTIIQMILYSTFSGIITYFLNGDYLDFIKYSFIVSFSIIFILLACNILIYVVDRK